MSGDALAAGEGSIALANNTADGDVTEGQYGGGWFPAGAGNDMLGDGAEGYSGENGGDDVIAGDALATNRNGRATANNLATAAGVAVGSITLGIAAGNDTIRGGGGDDADARSKRPT